MTVLDLFAGAGGLSLGLVEAGFHVSAAVELDDDAAATYREHHPTTAVLRSDVNEVDFSELAGEVELLAGGPPCQPFSTGGLRLGEKDPRDGLPAMLRAIEAVQPRAVLLENVSGLARGTRRNYLHSVLARLEALGYSACARVLDAADYGVPQRRQRLFIVGVRCRHFQFPEPTHGPGRQARWRTAGEVVSPDAVVGHPNPSIVTYARNPDLRPSPYDGHMFNGGGRPLDLVRPSRTILASAGGNKTHFIDCAGIVPPYHRALRRGGVPRTGVVEGARRLTAAESALLQSFPNGMWFAGSTSRQYTQIGNAVPPRLAAAVAAAVSRALRRKPVLLAA